ncbi:MAG: aminotransferase class I/II-fold pyridoxal phosphate-dependent enzyme [Treponemataceae bacterium]|uniref:O-acetylhomoserine aminocarboxypropyltransferase/cysteine synthase family protein n=1 Tax=Treponema sp. J25 TaxID=2094121 RepID=UPI001050AF78|nr:aminotransferase class I/II-fold pyridoxal phosphate-dependent enzyme [Treponema sp. J25]MCX7948488.1 aminotransferase class I/II-fold pyridoxal phosphate-dependent enzyme [Treponemataceae bacterium]HOJ98389.1 aminotransferase class I/II-fold pyridoxal phosphate-dependent enzyme [Termitinemataceae bacterium]TCW62065.1 O-acetylhomoserine aminocarboxypropyltransferase [Treponema sp. J25]HOM23513.1 aminotransferase class I/II-fold pyridoxal phosphate-dependent enzyme [Termitinemataceae bacteriu
MNKYEHFETATLHGGQEPDPTTLSRAVPVYRTSSYVFKSADHAARLFALKEFGNIYSRLGNPTNEVLEQRVSILEGGAASVAVSSGTSAIFYAIITLAKAGDEIISAPNLYGGTYTMFDAILPDLGITVRFADHRDPESFDRLVTEKTRAFYIETIGNPVLDVIDIEAVAAIAKKHHLPLIVDGTFTTPYLLRTIEHGANIVINSLTKWMGGHGTAIGGIMTDAGNFDWSDPRFSLFTQPDRNYHGLRWALDLPPELARIAFALRFRTVPLRNLGACLSPDNAWIFLQGLETLHLRMSRHSENALQVAQFLAKHPKVAWVRYPGLPTDPTYPIAQRYLKRGFGGMVVFGPRGGKAAAERFIDGLRLFSHLANVGDAKSLALHPASTSHSQLTEEQQREGGLSPDLVRLSIGLESIEDIIGDIEQSLGRI